MLILVKMGAGRQEAQKLLPFFHYFYNIISGSSTKP